MHNRCFVYNNRFRFVGREIFRKIPSLNYLDSKSFYKIVINRIARHLHFTLDTFRMHRPSDKWKYR